MGFPQPGSGGGVALAPVNSVALGTAAAAGVAPTAMRSDDTIAALSNAPSVGLGMAAGAGVSPLALASDATLAAFDATNPTLSLPRDTAAPGAVNLTARRDHIHGRDMDWVFVESGWLACTCLCPESAAGTATPAAATQYFFKAPIPQGGAFTTYDIMIAAAGATMTNTFVYAYDSAGNLLVQSADQSAAFVNAANNNKWLSIALSGNAGAQAAAKYIWLGFYFGTAVTPPTIQATSGNIQLANAPGLAAAALRVGTLALANTATMPATINPAAMSVASLIKLCPLGVR